MLCVWQSENHTQASMWNMLMCVCVWGAVQEQHTGERVKHVGVCVCVCQSKNSTQASQLNMLCVCMWQSKNSTQAGRWSHQVEVQSTGTAASAAWNAGFAQFPK